MQWNKQNIAYQGGRRCSDDSMHLNFLELHSASVCNRSYNHLKIFIPRPKNGETNHIVILVNRVNIVLCSLFSMACHLACDTPHTTVLFVKPGESSLKFLNGRLKDFTEEKCVPMGDPMTKEKLTSHYVKNRQIGPLEIDLRHGFSDSSNSTNNNRSKRSSYVRSLVFDLGDCGCAASLSDQINNNSGVCLPPYRSQFHIRRAIF